MMIRSFNRIITIFWPQGFLGCVALATTHFEQQKHNVSRMALKAINQLSLSWNLDPKHIGYVDDISWLLTDFPNDTRKGKHPGGFSLFHNIPNF